ncbi:hypothetical protein LRAMOSA06058 [Lichtheimia ramosa]|uniref:F-box domain-containing protein n=2 Tax=Lichtheimia ramosa TaxID=688394 RepID=A0A077X337_9FUNG|nr:hypothetical protein LRAMOSA06058 [Lichtheimia ramosa]
MLTKLPTELLHIVLGHLRFRDLETLLNIGGIAHVVRHCLVRRFRFQYQASSLLRQFEGMPSDTRKDQETRHSLANQLLELICQSVEKCARQDQRAKFTELLSSLEKWVVRRVLSGELPTGMELDYADLCLDIRYMYLHRPAVRVLHDAKYRRRSTKYPLAPFLPREFTSIWRRQCSQGAQMLAKSNNVLSVNNAPLCRAHATRLHFARFFGKLFKVTSLYLESNLDGTFQECVREALVSGDVESLIVMRSASGRQEDVESMCMMVSTAAEQLWAYLNSMGDLMMADPTSEQQARLVHPPVGIQDDDNNNDDIDGDDDDEALSSPPDWLMPQRYTIHDDTRLRLKIMDELCQKGWCWFN